MSTIVLFDVDGTLTASRKAAAPETITFLRELRRHVKTGMVGGSDLSKQKEQLGEDVLGMFDYVFPENGLMAFKAGAEIGRTSLREHLGDARIREFVNFVLGYLAVLDIPVKRGTFIEFRAGMINVSPIGRNCSQSERDEFEVYDKEHGIRARMVAVLEARFAGWGLKYSIGGQISFDVFPLGWDKTFCLKYVTADGLSDIHFFGDKVMPGGNDFEIYTSPLVKGHATTGPDDTIAQCRALFMSGGAAAATGSTA